jgi:outer membrane protein assembly factor BamA
MPLVEDGVAVVPITVDPGPAFLLGTVAFEGRRALTPEDLADAAGVMTGAPYDPAAIDAARDRLVTLYRRHGFAAATVTPRAAIRPEEPRVDVTFAIQEGAGQTIGDIVVSGNSGVDPDVITRAMRLTVGAPLEPEELLRARTRVFDTGLFRRVDLTTEAMSRTGAGDPAQPMRVRVEVDAWPALRLRYGFQATEEHPDADPTGRRVEPGLSADVTRRTLFGRPVSLGGSVQYQRRQSSERALLNAPTLMSLPVQSSLVLERAHRQSAASTFVTDTNSVSWEQRLRTSNHLTLSYAYRFDKDHTFNPAESSGSGLNFDVRINVARLIGAAAWDTRNDPFDAARGTLLSSSVQWGPDRLGSQFRFVKYVGQAYRFQNVGGVVFASAVRLGLVRALGGQELYVRERFHAGGSRTVRGVEEDSLGERDVFGDPAGGEGMLVLNQEARMPIYKWLRGVAFIDAGNVFPNPRAIRFNALTGSIGFGVRLTTPFALLRADYGRVAWGAGQRSGQWIVGIGQAF